MIAPRSVLVITHVQHHRRDGAIWAHGPYASEIELWAGMVPRLIIAAPCRDSAPTGDCRPLRATNIEMRPIPATGGSSVGAKLAQLWALPRITWRLASAIGEADAVHVRCPGNLGLLGAVLAPLLARRMYAKYAGQWSPYSGEPWSYRLQRALLRSPWWRGPVSVYGPRDDDPPAVVGAFTSVLSEGHLERARRAAARSWPHDPLRVLYVGRLTAPKNVDVLLSAVGLLRDDGVKVECTIVGDGAERAALERLTVRRRIADRVRFMGALPFDRVLDHYEDSDVAVLVSSAEGWGKALSEAMAFGLVCIGSDRGFLPRMMGEGRGLTVPARNAPALANMIATITQDPARFAPLRARAAAWGQRQSLDAVREALRELLGRHWGGAPESDGVLAAR